MPISPQTEELIAKAWLESIPLQYRFDHRNRNRTARGDRFYSSAIIAAPPPPSIVEMFLRSLFGVRHLTQRQIAARTARMNCGQPGRKREAP